MTIAHGPPPACVSAYSLAKVYAIERHREVSTCLVELAELVHGVLQRDGSLTKNILPV
jgi:hypothetical protein